MGDGAVSGAQKAALVRASLPDHVRDGLSSDGLITALGLSGYAFKCFHDEEGNMEVIVPKSLCAALTMKASATLVYKNWDKVK